MRNNQPVTGQAYPLRDDQSLISRTDAQGNINYVNEDFIELSGFSEAELIGSPHNMVRHPDMPVEAFSDMWNTLKSGQSWTGMVKNRRKDGDHYWVLANATPIRENGAITGFTSVRTAPTAEQISHATKAYARFKAGKAGGWQIRQGQVVRSGVAGALAGLKTLTIRGRLIAFICLLCLVMSGIGAIGLYGMNSSNAQLRTVFEDRIVPLGQLDKVVRLLNRNSLLVAKAINSTSPEEIKTTAKNIGINIEEVNANWQAYSMSYLTPEEKILADKFTLDRTNFVTQGLKPVMAALTLGNIDEVKRLEHDVIGPAFEPVRESVNALIQLQLDVAKLESESANVHFIFMRNIISAIIIMGIVLSFFSARFLIRAIVHPINQAVNLVREIAAGNLSANIKTDSNDEMGRMQHALNVMNKSLTNIVAGVRRNAEAIGSSSIEIANGNIDLSQRTEEQASTLEETAASMEELTSTVKSNADNSKQARELAHAASVIASQGGEAMSLVVGTMESIAASSQKITDIISVIEGIAFQTNILALNAAVEAARAGEQGRGFAVVASEVRNLAQRSAAAAKEIKELIGDSVSKVETGTKQVRDAGKTIDGVVTAVQSVSNIMNDITSASLEQSIGIEQVNQAVMQMDEVTQQNAALVEEAAAAAESMQMQGRALIQAMNVFRLSNSNAQANHGRAVSQAVRLEPKRKPMQNNVHSVKKALEYTSVRPVVAMRGRDRKSG
jgi:aerotaxis receptor